MAGFGTGHSTVTTHANFIPEIWSKQMQVAREARLVASRLFMRFDRDVLEKGDTIHVPKVTNLTPTAKSASTAVTFTATTEGKVDITIDKYYEISILIERVLSAQSQYELANAYRDKISYGLSKQMDTDILGLYSGLSQSVGTAGSPPQESDFLRAIQYLDDADAPQSDRVFIMKPATKSALLQIDKFVDQDFVGDRPVVTGAFGQRYGVTFYVSTNVPVDASSNPINLVAHKEAYAVAVQKNIQLMSDFVIEYLADAHVGCALYGVAEYRDNHGVIVYG